MLSIRNHRIGLATSFTVGVVCFIWGASAFRTMPILLISGMILLAFSVVWFHALMHIELLRVRAVSMLAPTTSSEAYKKNISNTMGNSIGSKVFRHGMAAILNRKHLFKLHTQEDGTPYLSVDIAFPSNWNDHVHLRSALGWMVVCLPPSLFCKTVERRKTRLKFTFYYIDTQRQDKEGLIQAVEEWKKTVRIVLFKSLRECSVIVSEHAPVQLNPQSGKPAPTFVPTSIFEQKIHLNQEHVDFHIGFDGTCYYTFMLKPEASTVAPRREYSSWAALWSVWSHIDEVKTAFTSTSQHS